MALIFYLLFPEIWFLKPIFVRLLGMWIVSLPLDGQGIEMGSFLRKSSTIIYMCHPTISIVCHRFIETPILLYISVVSLTILISIIIIKLGLRIKFFKYAC